MQGELSLQRVPPQSLEAEQAVLGSVLLENQTLIKALEIISDRHFYREAHRKIFAAILDLFERNEPADLLTLAERLRKKNQLDEAGGISYLSTLIDRLPSAANVHYHANIVKEKATLRSLISAATEIIAEGYNDTSDVDELLDRAEQVIFEISSTKTRSTYVNLGRVLKESFSTIERLFERKEAVTGAPTGFIEIDKLTSGLQPSDLIIIAGRPSTGKTSFALNIAHHIAVVCRTPVALFSLE
ncbi:MAG: replicative DNA helicase, partial [Candidatus Tectomicrobia bacterium]|nr:replicative DNA helicase [Candidatus Tectomicrobia bacterium]